MAGFVHWKGGRIRAKQFGRELVAMRNELRGGTDKVGPTRSWRLYSFALRNP